MSTLSYIILAAFCLLLILPEFSAECNSYMVCHKNADCCGNRKCVRDTDVEDGTKHCRFTGTFRFPQTERPESANCKPQGVPCRRSGPSECCSGRCRITRQRHHRVPSSRTKTCN